MTDTDLHELFAPLREAESRHDPAAIAARRRRRPRRRYALALGGMAAAAAAAILAAPAPDPTAPSAADVLRAAAAVAADQPPASPDKAYRYSRRVDRFTNTLHAGGREATLVYEIPEEQWLDADLRGPTRSEPRRIVSQAGDPALIKRLIEHTRYAERESRGAVDANGFGPRYRIGDLPTEPEALLQELERGVADDEFRKSVNVYSVRDAAISKARSLLENTNAHPQLRGALFEVLARAPGARSLGSVRDRLGRIGQGIALGGPESKMTIVIDSETAEVMSTATEPRESQGFPGETLAVDSVVTATAQVSSVGERR